MLELRLWKTHAADDELRAAEDDYLLHRTLVASIVESQEHRSLATRPRDHEISQPLLVVCLTIYHNGAPADYSADQESR